MYNSQATAFTCMSCFLHARRAAPCVLHLQTATQHTGHPGATHFLSCGIGHQRLRHALQGPLADSPPSAAAAQHAAVYLRAQGYTVLYLTGRKPAARNHVTTSVDGSAVLPTPVTSARLRRFFRASPASRALLLSQAGPHSSRALTILPTHEDVVSGILAVAAQRAFAASLLELPPGGECSAGGPEPALHELLADAQLQATPASSRLPMRVG